MSGRSRDWAGSRRPVRQAAGRSTQYSHPRTLNRSATENGGTSVTLYIQRLGAACFRDAGVADQHVS